MSKACPDFDEPLGVSTSGRTAEVSEPLVAPVCDLVLDPGDPDMPNRQATVKELTPDGYAVLELVDVPSSGHWLTNG
jgi:hypothetical protein